MARDDFEIGDGGPDVKAAGGVIVRSSENGREVAVIHRPKYMDWSLPKGKLEPGEGWLDAALREVEEETGYRCEASVDLPPVSYLDRKGRRKLVRYWLMEPISGEFEPHGEVDELRWVERDPAVKLLSYPHDRELVRKALWRHRWRRLLKR
jgi:8-oxo-dGTP pyrophosphatase MutT (NUDIX family)